MTDLSEVLPNFDLQPYRHLIHSLEKNYVSVSELISLDPVEIAKRCPLPLGDLKAMIQDVIKALQGDLEQKNSAESAGHRGIFKNKESVGVQGLLVKTLDEKIDTCLGGGILAGHLTEIVGESAAGKTQFALGLLLSAQLQPPHGLGKSAIYLSTEAPLNTNRLQQILHAHPYYQALSEVDRPSLDRIHTIATNDLETQEHIIRHQLPLAVKRFNVGLVVMDSVAANFRAEHETKNAKGLADRALDLTRLGTMFRAIARDYNVAVVVTNQVSDRFDDLRTIQDRIRSSSPLGGSSPMLPPNSIPNNKAIRQDEPASLDFQQRFFTGWGDLPTAFYEQLKTPALGMTWANQLSARIVLKMESERVGQHRSDYVGGNLWKDKKKRRFVGVVFAPWAPSTLQLVEYEITSHGAASVADRGGTESAEHPGHDMLDPSLWFDGAAEDEEFP